ncbi:UNVERIFIED_CONTAM: hypothetical protein Scaly_2244400 [Sesamum calycinum]|uniref:Integrase catalytic domain-containing protein n=1 Tax=Sesamum calycinum TaxID=2727403 RepID=A0AAW2MCK4_9LAMI
MRKGIGRGIFPNSLLSKVLQRSKKLCTDKVVLRLDDGKAVAVEVVGTVSLVISDHVTLELKDCYLSLNTQARGGFSYFIIFTNDHSRYGNVYLMRYKSEAFVGSKNSDLKLRTKLVAIIKTLRSDRGGEYLSVEFRDIVEPTISIDNVPILCRSARVPQPPLRYAFLGVMGQLDNDPKTYGEAMSNIDSGKYHEAMKFEMDSMSLNQVWKLVDRSKSVKPVRCKWVYKRKIGGDGEVTTFKAGLVAKGYTQRPKPEGFTVVGEEHKVCHLQSSIYGLKQAFRSWNICFEEVIRSYNFIKNDFDPCVYKKVDEQGGKFSVDHSLIDGDALAFQLFLPLVYNALITRVDGFAMTTNEKMKKWTRRDSLPQIRRRLHIRFKNKLQAFESTSAEKNQGITLNFRDPKSYIGHIYILAAIEYFSKWVETIPLKEVKKETVVDFIRISIIFRYGVPRYIITDNGRPFYNKLMVQIMCAVQLQAT